jgi:hypothetical protein
LPYQLSCFQNGKEAVDAIAQQLPRWPLKFYLS